MHSLTRLSGQVAPGRCRASRGSAWRVRRARASGALRCGCIRSKEGCQALFREFPPMNHPGCLARSRHRRRNRLDPIAGSVPLAGPRCAGRSCCSGLPPRRNRPHHPAPPSGAGGRAIVAPPAGGRAFAAVPPWAGAQRGEGCARAGPAPGACPRCAHRCAATRSRTGRAPRRRPIPLRGVARGTAAATDERTVRSTAWRASCPRGGTPTIPKAPSRRAIRRRGRRRRIAARSERRALGSGPSLALIPGAWRRPNAARLRAPRPRAGCTARPPLWATHATGVVTQAASAAGAKDRWCRIHGSSRAGERLMPVFDGRGS